MKNQYTALADALRAHGIYCEQDVSMKMLTTFQIGGDARLVLRPQKVEDIQYAFALLADAGVPVYLIGRGSNLLVSDDGIDGAVLLFGPEFGTVTVSGETLICEAGAPLIKVCREAQSHALTGLEFAYGIPGTVGGGVYMNAGAYGGEMKDVVCWCEHLTPDGTLVRLPAEALDFGYRHSVYTGKADCIVRVGITLAPGDPDAIASRMEELMGRRRMKQPLEWPSAGSMFQRPEGAYAGALIEQCGLKGARIGGAMVSEKHANFLINTGGATCADMKALIAHVQQTVKEQTGYTLVCEVRMI